MSKELKPVPPFKSEGEEKAFWATHDRSDYVDIPAIVVLAPLITLAGFTVWVAFNAMARSRTLRLEGESAGERAKPMTRLSWPAWIWLQVVIPLAAGTMTIGVLGIPFALVWPPMTTAQAWLVLVLGFGYFLFFLWAQKRKMYRDGMLPPFS